MASAPEVGSIPIDLSKAACSYRGTLPMRTGEQISPLAESRSSVLREILRRPAASEGFSSLVGIGIMFIAVFLFGRFVTLSVPELQRLACLSTDKIPTRQGMTFVAEQNEKSRLGFDPETAFNEAR
jgi:hypothetical protein